MRPSTVRVSGEEIQFEVRVVPRASRSEIGAWDEGGRLRVRVSSPPVDDAANEAIRELFARRLSIPRRDVRVVRGGTSRTKTLGVRGISLEGFSRAIGGSNGARERNEKPGPSRS